MITPTNIPEYCQQAQTQCSMYSSLPCGNLMPLVTPYQPFPNGLRSLWRMVLQTEAEYFPDSDGVIRPGLLISRAAYQMMLSDPEFRGRIDLFTPHVVPMPVWSFVAGRWTQEGGYPDYEDMCIMNEDPKFRWTIRFKRFQ